MISKINLLKLKNASHLLFMQEVSALATEVNHEKISPNNEELKRLLLLLEDGQKQVRRSAHTESLISLDKKRDEAYLALNYHLSAEERCPVQARKEAAQLLRIVLKSFGNPSKLNLLEQTSVINRLIAELRQPKYEKAIKQTSLTEWIGYLEAANQNFFSVYQQRRDDTAGQTSVDLKSVRKQVDAQYQKLTQRIISLMDLEPTEELTTMVNKLNATISKFKAMV